jgi:uncharacterized RDD family membrane protein YckC
MECPSCGALIESGIEQCSECAVGAGEIKSGISAATTETSHPIDQPSKLIEFPGVSRPPIPQWRKELSERVREVQEKRAREDALELGRPPKPSAETPEATSQLELLPHSEPTPVNPLVAAALRRIERAHETPYLNSNRASSAAVAYATPLEIPTAGAIQPYQPPVEAVEERPAEKAHNLVVVPAAAAKTAASTKIESDEETPRLKPRRMIVDINDPALNYLDSVPVAVPVETGRHQRASLVPRLVSAFIDLLVVTLLCAPVGAAMELSNASWENLRVWIFSAAVFSVVGFIYFTVSTALTGRTLGLRLLRLRIVDARTGLIPTGTQSAGRALIYLASLLILGITSAFGLLNPERLTAHDRITRTAVVHS